VVGLKENGDIEGVVPEVRFSKTTLEARGLGQFHNEIDSYSRKILVD
jgi:hypothetical protein